MNRFVAYVFLLIGICAAARLKAQPLPADVSLNGQWETGAGRNYTARVNVPGIVTDPTKMNEGRLWYKKEIRLPVGNWRHAVLELKGARFMPEVYIDGILVSAKNGGMAPTFHMLDSKAVKPGNKIVLEIALASLKDVPVTDASFIPPADQWRSNISSGLWDDVTLHFYNDYRIESAVPFFDMQRQSAGIHLDMARAGGANDINSQCTAEVLDGSGKTLLVQRQRISGCHPVISLQYGHMLEAWSPEHPHLYRLRITLADAHGRMEDRLTMPFGIKKIEVRDKQFYVNDAPCKVGGGTVVWHRWVRSKAGAALGYDTAWFHQNIIKRLKEHGANYLRFHLGKPPEALLDLCDRYGLLVQYEWSFFHGMPASGQSLLEQYREWLNMAMRHPSVAFIHPYNETEGSQLDTVWTALDTLLKRYPPLVLEGRDVTHVHKYWWSLFENLGLYYDSYRQFAQPIMVDEFGGNYLDEKGDPGAYPTVRESYLRFLGRAHTKDMRLSHQAQSCGKVAEYWRRIGAAGIAPFCILSSNDDGNNWFMGPLAQGNPKPVWNALTAAWSPQSVSIELWDRNFTPGQAISLPVYVFNDVDKQQRLRLKITITDSAGRLYENKSPEADMAAFSRTIKQVPVKLPLQAGNYTISAELVNRPAAVKYPVVSSWQVHVFSKRVPANLASVKVAVPANEPELKAFLQQVHIPSTDIKDTSAAIVLTSVASWNAIAGGDKTLPAALKRAIERGQSVVMLDIGDRRLGQGYPANDTDLGPLQGVVKIADPRQQVYNLFGGIAVRFTEAAEPESHIHPDKNNNALWEHIPLQDTWLWNGLRAGLIVPASDMEFSGLNAPSFLAQWKSRGADENKIVAGHYYAYELQGFYDYASTGSDDAVKKKLKQKLQFLAQDAPSLATYINPETPVKVTDLGQAYADARNAMADTLAPLVNAGKNLTRIPVVMLGFGKGRGRLIASQLLTAGRLLNDGSGKKLYDIRYDEVAVQFVLNMMSVSVKNMSPD